MKWDGGKPHPSIILVLNVLCLKKINGIIITYVQHVFQKDTLLLYTKFQ